MRSRTGGDPAGHEITPLDLSDEEPAASERGLAFPSSAMPSPPPHKDIRAVAVCLLVIFGACLLAILGLATLVVWCRPDSLKDMLGFFGTVIATLGTLLGGVVAFYFSRR